jgi:hypothetical protein
MCFSRRSISRLGLISDPGYLRDLLHVCAWSRDRLDRGRSRISERGP